MSPVGKWKTLEQELTNQADPEVSWSLQAPPFPQIDRQQMMHPLFLALFCFLESHQSSVSGVIFFFLICISGGKAVGILPKSDVLEGIPAETGTLAYAPYSKNSDVNTSVLAAAVVFAPCVYFAWGCPQVIPR